MRLKRIKDFLSKRLRTTESKCGDNFCFVFNTTNNEWEIQKLAWKCTPGSIIFNSLNDWQLAEILDFLEENNITKDELEIILLSFNTKGE